MLPLCTEASKHGPAARARIPAFVIKWNMDFSASSLAAFRHKGYRYFQAARFLTILSAEMVSLAVGWQLYSITHRALDLGLVGLAQFLPGLLLFLVTGYAADRLPRQRILFVCMLAFALCSGLLFYFDRTGMTSTAPIYAVLVLLGVARAFHGPTGQALMPQLAPPEDFQNAVSWGSSTFQTATILGPMLGGLTYSLCGGAHWVYACGAVGNLIAASFAFCIVPKYGAAKRRDITLDSLFDGFRYVWANKIVLGSTTLDLFAVLLGGATALLPVYAKEILHAGPLSLGLLRSAPGLGSVTVAVLLAHRPLRRRVGRRMFACVAGFGLFTIVFGLSHNLALSMAALFFLGACDAVSVIVRGTLVQMSTPDAMRGRVSSVNMLFIGASNEFGQFESGVTAQWMGAVPAVVLGGVGTICVVLAWMRLFPALRKVDNFRELLGPEAN